MGGMKELMEQEREDEALAFVIMERAGVATICEPHDVAIDNYGDLTDAYRLMNTLISRDDELVARFKGDRRRATDAIQAAHGELAMECGFCAKYLED